MDQAHRHPIWRLAPIVVFGVGLAMTVLAVHVSWKRSKQQRNDTFQQESQDLVATVRDALQQHAHLLDSKRALFSASRSVERHEWREFTHALGLDQRHPAVVGCGFVQQVPPSDVTEFLDRVRADGAPEFTIHASKEGARHEVAEDGHYVLVFQEPAQTTVGTWGVDLGRHPETLEALRRARDTGQMAMSQRRAPRIRPDDVTFDMCLPIYDDSVDGESSVEARRRGLLGWAFLPIDAQRMLAPIRSQDFSRLAVAIYDAPSADHTQQVFASGVADLSATEPWSGQIRFAGRTWTVQTQPTENLAVAFPWGLGAWCFSVGALLALIVWTLSHTQSRAVRIAAEMTTALRLNERRLEQTGHVAKVGGWELDLKSGAVTWTDEVRRIHEVSPDFEPTLESAMRFYAPEARATIEQAISRGIAASASWDLELPLITARGRRIWVRTMGEANYEGDTLVSLAGAFQDVTERRSAEERYASSEQRLSLALRAAQQGLWDWDLDTGDAYFSDLWYEMLGYYAKELPMTTATVRRLIHPDDRHGAIHSLRRYLAGEGERFRHEYRMRTKNGDWRWVLNIGELTEADDEGNARRLIGVHIDIDKQKRFEVELRHARESADAANRSKSEFLANMSHEIRTPMTAILGFADVLLEPTLSSEDRKGHILTIKRNGDHLLSLLNDILDLSKIDSGRLEVERIPTSIPLILSDVTSLLEVRANGKGLELLTNIEHPFPEFIETDPVRLRQILMNLVGNAIKFTEQGQVAITASHKKTAAGSLISFAVKDTGVGIPKDSQGRLFNDFTQADASTTRRHGGTGLGLAISRRLAKILGGDIALVSEPGNGSTFTVTIDAGDLSLSRMLPEQIEGPAAVTPAERTKVSASCEGRILLAEDGPDNQRLISHILRKAGADVTIVGNGQEAVDHALEAEAAGAPFDVILMDMQMPILDGYAATRTLRDRNYTRPIVALTAHAMSADRDRCLAAGCDEYSTKPINKKALFSAIDRVRLRDTNPA